MQKAIVELLAIDGVLSYCAGWKVSISMLEDGRLLCLVEITEDSE